MRQQAADAANAAAGGVADISQPGGNQDPARPTTPEPTGPPRKIPGVDIAAKLP